MLASSCSICRSPQSPGPSFPLPYSPFHNWLSDLGNPEISPSGAGFYDLGLALTAGCTLIFFLGLLQFRLRDNRVQTIMTILTAVFGSLGAFGMLMSTVYPIHHPAAHSFWSMVNFTSTGTGFGFSIAAFRYSLRYPRWLLAFGAIVVLATLAVCAFFITTIFLSEWVVISLWLAYCPLLGMGTLQLRGKTTWSGKTSRTGE